MQFIHCSISYIWGKRCFDAAKTHNGTLTGMLSRDTDSVEKKLKQQTNFLWLKWIEMDQLI